MGKGDKKTKRGKVIAGSYGKHRPRRKSKPAVAVVEEKPVKSKVEKAEPKPKATKPKIAKPVEAVTEEKPKTIRKKKTEE